MSHENCPVPDSEDKFQEAHYFINGMLHKYHNPDEFRWNLNAFLQALRSVTFILQNEMVHRNGFKEWWESQQQIMKADKILNKFRDGRNIVVKQGMLHFNSTADVGLFRFRKLKLTFGFNAPVKIPSAILLERAKEHFIPSLLDEEHSEIGMELGIKRVWRVDELGKGEVVTLCDKAWSRIGRIVANAHEFCGFSFNVPPEQCHNIETASVLVESEIDPTLPKKWGWTDS